MMSWRYAGRTLPPAARILTEAAETQKEKIAQFTEFESKYRVEGDKIYQFKEIVEALPDESTFVYIQGPDYYFVRDDERFARYRKADNDKSGRAEVTFKLISLI